MRFAERPLDEAGAERAATVRAATGIGRRAPSATSLDGGSAPSPDLTPRRDASGRAGEEAPRLPGLNPGLAKEALTRFIHRQVEQAGVQGVVVGLSGGLDSAVVAALCAAALGASRVLGLHLPSPWSHEEDRRDALEHARGLGIPVETVPLATLREAYAALEPEPGRLREGNFTARLRMALLYDRSARDSLLVAGTSNKTEALLGYTTLWGDMAAAFSPLGDLYKTQVRELAELLGVSREIREKAPSAGLWSGQTDEEELGATYEELDRLLYHYVDLRYDLPALVAAGFDERFARRTIEKVHANEFKRRMPLIPKLSNRTIGHDWLYPRHWRGPLGAAHRDTEPQEREANRADRP
jgi:NAD+ synthase